MKNKFLLLVAALVLSTTATFATPLSLSLTIDETASNGSKVDMIELVRQYMDSHDICCLYIAQEQGTTNYLVKDTFGIWYRVYTDGASINGHSEIDF